MPHIFKVECYRRHVEMDKAKIGDVVYLKARPDVPMSVCARPTYNSASGTMGHIKCRWLKPDGTPEMAEFIAQELSL